MSLEVCGKCAGGVRRVCDRCAGGVRGVCGRCAGDTLWSICLILFDFHEIDDDHEIDEYRNMKWPKMGFGHLNSLFDPCLM